MHSFGYTARGFHPAALTICTTARFVAFPSTSTLSPQYGSECALGCLNADAKRQGQGLRTGLLREVIISWKVSIPRNRYDSRQCGFISSGEISTLTTIPLEPQVHSLRYYDLRDVDRNCPFPSLFHKTSRLWHPPHGFGRGRIPSRLHASNKKLSRAAVGRCRSVCNRTI